MVQDTAPVFDRTPSALQRPDARPLDAAAGPDASAGTAPGDLVAVLGDAVVVSDAGGAITVWNAAAERIFGYAAEEALGRNLDLITPERLRARHWHGYHASMRTGRTRYGTQTLRVPAVTKDGRALSIAFTIGMLRGADGAVAGVAAVIRDETERWNEERALRRRLAELETRLAEAEGASPAQPLPGTAPASPAAVPGHQDQTKQDGRGKP